MIIIGAKGFAKEVCEVLLQQNYSGQIAFFDNVSTDLPEHLFERFPVIRNIEKVQSYMQLHGNGFVIGVGNPIVRFNMAKLLISAGGEMMNSISPFAKIGVLGNSIKLGCNVMTGTVITSDVEVGEGVLINLNCTIGHDVRIGNYAELSPGVHLSGQTSVGEFSVLGTGSVVIPRISIGKNSIVAAGSVVTKNVPDNVMVAGAPAIIKKELPPLEI